MGIKEFPAEESGRIFRNSTNRQTFWKKLIKIYQDYLENGEIKNKESLLLHNHEDLIGLHKIYSLMSYPALLDKEFTLSSHFIENDHFVAHLNLDIQIPVSCNYKKSGISLTLDHSNAILTCPLENGHLKTLPQRL